MIDNPFESGQIKNYIMAYVSVVVIMILFFVASTLFNDVKKVKKKKFENSPNKTMRVETKEKTKKKDKTFKLLQKGY